jgi:tetratricopeptide (TPR) repeat protein
VLALLAALVGTASAQEDAFAQANHEFAAGRFREAIDLYAAQVQRGETSAALFYNLGNAWYRAGDLGQAILNYERALALEPHHPETQANLRFVRDKARALELRRNWRDRVIGRNTATQYSAAAATSFWVAAFAMSALFLNRSRRRLALTTALFLSLIVLFASVYALWALETGSTGRGLAIVTAKTTDARVATADNAGTVLALPPGSEIKILNTRGDWTYAVLPNDLRGWIPAKNAERVRL